MTERIHDPEQNPRLSPANREVLSSQWREQVDAGIYEDYAQELQRSEVADYISRTVCISRRVDPEAELQRVQAQLEAAKLFEHPLVPYRRPIRIDASHSLIQKIALVQINASNGVVVPRSSVEVANQTRGTSSPDLQAVWPFTDFQAITLFRHVSQLTDRGLIPKQ